MRYNQPSYPPLPKERQQLSPIICAPESFWDYFPDGSKARKINQARKCCLSHMHFCIYYLQKALTSKFELSIQDWFILHTSSLKDCTFTFFYLENIYASTKLAELSHWVPSWQNYHTSSTTLHAGRITNLRITCLIFVQRHQTSPNWQNYHIIYTSKSTTVAFIVYHPVKLINLCNECS